MADKNSSFDTDAIGSIIGVVIFIVIPFVFLFWYGGQNDTSTTNTTESYSDYDQWRDEQRQNEADALEQEREQEFEGYSCTSDCSGHQAGYDWAQSNSVCDPSYSGGNSQSFNEGVRSWASSGC